MNFKFIVLALLFFTQSAFAFTLTTPNEGQKGWENASVELLLNPEGCPGIVEELIQESMDVWNGIETSNLKLSLGYTSIPIQQASAGASQEIPAIYCVSQFSQTVPGIDANSIPGFATAARLNGQDYLDYGIIVLNTQDGAAANISTMDRDVVKIVLAHEIGHLLGLGHSKETKALMYYSAGVKTKLGLSKDDVDGMTYLYPRDELGKDKMLGCGVVLNSGAYRSSLFFVIFSVLVIGSSSLIGKFTRTRKTKKLDL